MVLERFHFHFIETWGVLERFHYHFIETWGVLVFLKFGDFSCEFKETESSSITEFEVGMGNFNAKARKTTKHKLHKISRSLKFLHKFKKTSTPQDAAKIPARHMRETGSLNLSPIHAPVIYQIDFAEITEFEESSAPFGRNSNIANLVRYEKNNRMHVRPKDVHNVLTVGIPSVNAECNLCLSQAIKCD